ncbi:hypothetical protein [Roseateles violae]|uniref:Uncharacterized protein n=1 Tax=Roseateles violae TaxID=3058042 RepID=A0ABT8DNW7_9BURK|nr:hypothetical protein [Pelomonas sp. PFR6]MDN3919668.1 hypothetical protein [Pelomonas sp. PFR6]
MNKQILRTAALVATLALTLPLAHAQDPASLEAARVNLLGTIPERASVSDEAMVYIRENFRGKAQRQAAAKYAVIAHKAMAQVTSTGKLDLELGKQIYASSDCIAWLFPMGTSDYMKRMTINGLRETVLNTDERKEAMKRTMALAAEQGHKRELIPRPESCEAIGVAGS